MKYQVFIGHTNCEVYYGNDKELAQRLARQLRAVFRKNDLSIEVVFRELQ